jgi:hypothetical protein
VKRKTEGNGDGRKKRWAMAMQKSMCMHKGVQLGHVCKISTYKLGDNGAKIQAVLTFEFSPLGRSDQISTFWYLLGCGFEMIAFQPISYATLLLAYTSNLYHVLSIGNN